MATVALIGPDGAGKTTLARMLLESRAIRFRYLYMGINTSSSNVALPTSRLVELARRRGGATRPGARRPRGVFWRSARLLNRVAEEWYRQALSWWYQLRGYTVLYDRHFLFDFSTELSPAGLGSGDQRLHRWLLRTFYPRPDLVIMLDAPGTVLFERKGESTPEELEARRHALLREGRRWPGFVRLDATLPADELRDEIETLVLERLGRTTRRATRGRAPHLQNAP